MAALIDNFSRYFEVVPVDSDALRETVFRLRYQVYCVETGFEDAARYPDRLERDAFDGGSAHTLLRHRATGWWAGTVRLVLPHEDSPEQLFPAEIACGRVFSPHLLGAISLPRASAAEVSRFAVSREFRRRHAEYLSPTGISVDMDYDRRGRSELRGASSGECPERGAERRTRSEERKMVPHITLGLIEGLVAMSGRHGVSHWCAVMEHTLLRLLTRFGIYFQHVGSPVEYHGKRQPCVASLDNLLLGVKRQHYEIWEVLTDRGRLWPDHVRAYEEAGGSARVSFD